jgi:hypothetical protein
LSKRVVRAIVLILTDDNDDEEEEEEEEDNDSDDADAKRRSNSMRARVRILARVVSATVLHKKLSLGFVALFFRFCWDGKTLYLVSVFPKHGAQKHAHARESERERRGAFKVYRRKE